MNTKYEFFHSSALTCYSTSFLSKVIVNRSGFNAIQQTMEMCMRKTTRVHQTMVAKSTKQLSFYPINAITPLYNT